jgi:hypothetical protein
MTNDQQHVNYIGLDSKVHELWYSDSGGWKHNILSDLAGADDQNSLAGGSALAGYTTPWTQQQHVIYFGADNKVRELVYSDREGWQQNIRSDLAKVTGTDNPESGSVFTIDAYTT